MQTAIYGSYSDGVVTLDEMPENHSKARVVVLFLKKDDDSLIISRRKKDRVLTRNDFSPPFLDTENWHFSREEANERLNKAPTRSFHCKQVKQTLSSPNT